MRSERDTGPNGPAARARDTRRTNGGRRGAGFALLAVIATIAAGGGAFAATLTEQQVGARENLYGVSFTGVANWPSVPAIGAGTVPSTTTACDASYSGTSGATYYAGTQARLILGQGLNGTCKGGDFAETLTFSAASYVSSETDTFTFVASWTTANGTTETSSDVIAVDVVGGATASTGIEFVLDMGSTAPPASIAGLSIVVT